MIKNLKKKKIIISAGASGIGWSAAKLFLAAGATVYICDISKKMVSKTKSHSLNNKKLFSYVCDASNEIEVKNFFNQVTKKTNKIDALINNVGIAGPTGTMEKTTNERLGANT